MIDYTSYFLHPEELPAERGKVISLGAFDGCHLGHQKLLSQVDYAVTFMPTPKMFFSATAQVLMLPEEKRQKFDRFIFLKFDERLVALSPRQFIDMILMALAPSRIVVGWDFHFGNQLSGNVHALQKLAEEYDFDLDVVEPVKLGHHIVKSTTIRDLVTKGHIEQANEMLGYDYFFLSKVIPGKQLGRTLGFPTANLEIDSRKILPPKGVYAGYADVSGKMYKAAISIVERKKIELEAFLLDFNQDIYGETIKLSFHKEVRGQKDFPTLDHLKTQIAKDVEQVRDILNLC